MALSNTTTESADRDQPEATDFDQQLRDAIGVANIPTLLLVLVQLTGDKRWLDEPYRPVRSRGVDDNDTGGLSTEIQDRIRDGAFDAIRVWHRDGEIAVPEPSPELLVEMMTASEGAPVPEKYAGIMTARLKSFSEPDTPSLNGLVPAGFTALIVGAGMSGICAAIKFQQAGVPYIIVEKQSNTGGVWHSHRYPGCSVDTPSHLYSYTFDGGDWSRYFPPQAEIDEYFRGAARRNGIYDEIRFGTEVLASEYDECEHIWVSRLRNPDGTEEIIRTNVLISAVGLFAEPIVPDIAGLDEFDGPVVHTARWDSELDLTGKRVAVVGTGASAMQLAPAIVDDVHSLTIFQRSRQWAAPFPKFHKPVPDPIRFLMREVPLYQHWYRIRLSWIFDSKTYPSLQKDPNWEDTQHSINAINAGHRRFFERYIREELGDREDLAPNVIPNYPPYGKRMLLDNGWFRMLTRPEVTLVDNADDGIDHISGNTIHTRNGNSYEVDVIILATGYNVARMLSPLPIKGRNGLSIRDAWDDTDPRAYLGTVVPDFPNLFVLYGPNTQLGHGGAFIFVMECQIDYVLKTLRAMFEAGVGEVECRRDVFETYNDAVQERHQQMIWTHQGMTTYVRNDKGRVVGNNPWELVEFWSLLNNADLGDYHLVENAVEVGVR
ncbi:NAD(P)/FAD-dependent oxidoreductase [Rhodococcus opacus]|uniref:NAD(P)/FAD-dependent oxidoreductase n=1 Tax=Rhodococcus opacus TaxID=37919 RepID=A0AAX3YRV4_RHOOP|nr:MULTISPECIES: NAD(P)/FAD-dependent oxidoreductase [Rhodococcus]MCZ4586168.1 NAD(P)/FAD-dependent oxidoreductase [Rhodococcus opacus]WLF51898.1 NAD(P)/FAD-dependent oxidoreductase [Rhodococcus opacus]